MATGFLFSALCVFLLHHSAFTHDTELFVEPPRDDDVISAIPDQDAAAGRLFRFTLPGDATSNVQVRSIFDVFIVFVPYFTEQTNCFHRQSQTASSVVTCNCCH